MPRGVAGRRGLRGGWEMRRDDGCDERDSRGVEGRQGHEPGGTIGADGMRPPIEMHSSDKQDGCHSLRGQTTCFWLRAFLLGSDRPGVFLGAVCAALGCPTDRLPPAECAGASSLSGSR